MTRRHSLAAFQPRRKNTNMREMAMINTLSRDQLGVCLLLRVSVVTWAVQGKMAKQRVSLSNIDE